LGSRRRRFTTGDALQNKQRTWRTTHALQKVDK
jgi:hypothetical protein